MSYDNNMEGEDGFKRFPRRASSLTVKNNPFLLGIMTFATLAVLIGFLAYERFLINKERIQKDTYDFAVAARERLQTALEEGATATKTLSFFIGKDGVLKNFDSVASQIVAANPGIDALELVPYGIIRNIYPLKGNEPAIGYDILKDPTRNKEAFKAIQKKQLFYAGPLLLKQGGMAVVGRLPVFRNNKFWGFSAVVIKLATLFKAAGIDTLGRNGYYFQLIWINPDTHQPEYFITNPTKFDTNNAMSVEMRNGEWTLAVTPAHPNEGYGDFVWLMLLGFLVALLGGFFVFTVAKRPQKLDRLVKMRTAALQESESKYRSLIEQAADGVIVFSYDGTIHQFNKAAYTGMGYTEKEFAKLNLKDLLPESKVAIGESGMNEMRSGKSATFQRKLFKKDGSVIDIEINASLLVDGNLLAFIRNITERKKTERALKESEEKFSKAFQSNLLGFAIYDEDEKVIDANESYAQLLEMPLENIVGKNSDATKLTNKISATKREEVQKSIRNIFEADGRVQNLEIEIETDNGKVIYLLLSIDQFEINAQKHYLFTANNITEKKNAELSLIQSEIKYRSLIEQASDGIAITDLNGFITEVNRSMCEMIGYSNEEMIGRHVTNFIPKEDITGQPLRINELRQGKALRYERRLLKKGNVITDVEINSKMATNTSLIGFVRDITERKKAEEEIKKSNERFELIAKATKDAIGDHDFLLNRTVGNDNLYDLYGFTPGKDKIDMTVFESRLHPDDRERTIKNMWDLISKKAQSITNEFRFRTADGTYKYLYGRAYVTYNDDGSPARIIGVMQDLTRRIEDEQKLLKEKELSDLIINGLPGVFYLYSRDGKFLRWNKNFETVTGYTTEEMYNLHPLDFFEGEEKVLLAEKIRNVFINGKDNIGAHFLLKNKQKIPYYFTGMKIDYEGEACLLGFGLDFSDKVRSDNIIKESEQKFRSLVEEASDGVMILSEQGAALYISPSVERILGYTEAGIMQLNPIDLAHPGDRKRILKVFCEVMQTPGVPAKGHVSRILHKNGSWRWLEITFTNMLHVPSINGIVENYRDITEKLEIEKKVVAEKELSDSIINSLPGIFYLYNSAGRFIRWNKNFETVTGYSPEEIGQMHPLDFYDEDQQVYVKKRIKDVFKENLPAAEFLLQTKGGEKIPFFYNSIAIIYEGVPCIVGMAFDVTERKKMDQKLLISNQQLALKASELKTSYEELERFTYIVSHDLQEPLRMVSSFLKLLEQRYKAKLDETGEKYIHFAVDGALRMKQLIMDLLEYSRTGTNRDLPVNTDMNEVMADVLSLFANMIQELKAVVNVSSLPVLPGTSKVQMFQLMQNLLSNALKYHSEKPLRIDIDAKEEDEQWLFSVKDNGIGLDIKFADKIFIIFQRLHSRDEFSGTGIGLSICKKIVEKHGGKIWVESEPDIGSTFYFTIPKKTVQVSE